MSTGGEQTTLDGGVVPDNDRGPRRGSSRILWLADPDTDVERVGAWIRRAREEGVIK
jgi:hypothetical protein